MPAEKKATKKTAAKTAKKAARKAVKKTVAKKAAPAKKTAGRPAAVRPPRPKPVTRIIARVDVRFGNSLFIRGEGGGLSWTEGTPMENISSDEWKWETEEADSGIVFKFLVNDEIWSKGEDQTVAAGGTSISTPTFY